MYSRMNIDDKYVIGLKRNEEKNVKKKLGFWLT